MLLKEFKLSPAVYLDRFNTESRKADETYLLYSARLRSILDAYLESRMIAKHPERIPDLLVCDRLKSTLPAACLNYVLSVEAIKDEGWLPPHILAETIDKYFSNRGSQGDRPRAGAIGVTNTGVKAYGTSPSGPLTTSGRPSRAMYAPTSEKSGGNNGARNLAMPRQHVASADRRCFKCGSLAHMLRNCPENVKTTPSLSLLSRMQIVIPRKNKIVMLLIII